MERGFGNVFKRVLKCGQGIIPNVAALSVRDSLRLCPILGFRTARGSALQIVPGLLAYAWDSLVQQWISAYRV